MTVAGAVGAVRGRSHWRTVALPTEHGGWGLTLEPVSLGLRVAPSSAGALLGVAAFIAFLVRASQARRDRCPSESVARSIAVGADDRGRRVGGAGRLCGSVGIASVAAALVLADSGSARLAAGMWLLLSARAAASIPLVRTQVARLRHVRANLRSTDVMHVVALAVGLGAVVLDRRMAAGFAGLVVLAVLQVVWLRRPPIAEKVLGMGQMMLGVGLVAVTAAGVLAS